MSASVGTPVPTELTAALSRNGIETVLGLDRVPISAIDQRPLKAALEGFAEAGGRYVYLYRYPNQAHRWKPAHWREPGLVKRFVEILHPSLVRVAEAGLTPLLPPLHPGGDYWDTAFLAETLEILMAKDPELGGRLGIAIVTPLDRDLTWGSGGPARWPRVRPFHTPAGSEDHRGFQIFAWYDEIVRERVGASLPQVAVASYPASGGPIQRAGEAAALAANGSLPAYLLCINLGPLAAEDGSPAAAVRMLSSSRPDDPAAGAPDPAPSQEDGLAVERGPSDRGQGAGPAEAAPPEPTAEPPADEPLRTVAREADGESDPAIQSGPADARLEHYLLFPTWDFGVSEWYWRMATEYIRRFQPACGFRPEEAALARFVTIIGDERGVGAETEKDLAARGCRVERISGEDAESTRKLLESLVQQGRRFLSWEEMEWS